MEKCSTNASESLGLTSADQTQIKNLYESRLVTHGTDVKTVGWNSTSDQHMRFEVLCRGLDLRGKRILDIGCGLGDFVPWAEGKFGPDFDYLGMDLCEGLVNVARSRFESPRRKFVADTLSSKMHSGSFDIAVLSGTLTFKTSDNLATMGSLLENAWRISKEAVCCNFMTKYCDFQLEKNYHYSPEDVFRHAKSFSQFVNLIHDYELYEFTVQIFHAAAVKRKKDK